MARFFNSSSLADIVAGTQAAYEVCSPPKFVLEVKDATHFTFCQAVYQQRPVGGDWSLPDRQVTVINKYATAFLMRYLSSDASGTTTLQQIDPMLTRYRHEM